MLSSRHRRLFLFAVGCSALALAGCSGRSKAPGTDAGMVGDGSVDDGGYDAGNDAGMMPGDGGHDAGTTPDAGYDAGTDASMPGDASVDSGTDASMPGDASVDAGSDGGSTSPVSGMCSAPVVVTDGTMLTGQDVSVGSDDLSSDCRSSASGPNVYYQLTIPAGEAAIVVVTPDSSLDATIRVLDSCLATSCLSSVDSHAGGGAETLSYYNGGTADQTVILAVGAYLSSSVGTFSMQVTFVAPTGNGACSAATTVTPGTPLTGQDVTMGVADLSGDCLTYANGPNLFYEVTVPNGMVMTAVATPDSSMDATIRLLDSCSATSCMAAVNDGYTGDPESLRYANTTGSDQTLILAVGANDSSSTGTFSLSVSMAAPAGNTVCTVPTTVSDGTTLVGEDASIGFDDLSSDCLSYSTGPNVYYQVTVPMGMVLSATVSPDTVGMDPTIRLLDSCSATSCMAGVNDGYTGDPENLYYTNTTSADQTLIMAVGSYDTSTTGTFDLAVSIAPPPANATCTSATVVSDGDTISGDNPALGTDTLDSACLSSDTGTVLYYSVTVPDGMSLNVNVTPSSYWNPNIRLLDSCGATACMANADGGYSGDPESLSYTNTTGSSQDLILAVGSSGTGSPGPFDMSVSVAPPPYTETMITASCDDMTGATVVSGIDTDDSASATATMLPFNFDVIGDTMTSYWISSNGFMSLETSAVDPTGTYFSNHALPNTGSDPVGVVAPFWDDLAPPSSGTSSVSVETFGSSPDRHFTVQWTDWSFAFSDTADMTFQVKLFETSNVVEFHYCSMTDTDSTEATRLTGDSATVGIENSDNTSAYQHSFDTSGSVISGTAIRLTPNP